MAWLGTWAKRLEITASNTNIDSDVTHFSLLLKLGTSVGTGSADVSCVFDELTSDANRKKIAVTKSDGTTQIYVEIEKWDDANESAWLWVSKSDLTFSSSGTTTLYLYYDSSQSDNTTYVADVGARSEVYDSDHELVWHMGDLTTSSVEDSTSNGEDGAKVAANEPAVTTSGAIADAQTFDGADDYIASSYYGVGGSGPRTVEVIVKTSANQDQTICVYGVADTSQWFRVRLDEDTAGGSWVVRVEVSGGYRRFSTQIDDGDPHYIAVVVPSGGSTDDILCYVDGSLDSEDAVSDAAINTDNGTNPLHVGLTYGEANDYPFDGDIDEFRFSSVARNAAWIKATKHSLFDDLISWGSEETTSITSIKTLNGTAIAAIAKWNGIAIVDCKTILGISNVS